MTALAWQEMRDRAVAFATRWRGESRERGEAHTFWNEWFEIFGISRRRVAIFEQLSERHSTGGRGFMDVFWPGYLAGEQKSRGSDLDAAMAQALDYLPSIPEEHLPRLVVVCDFARFVVRDLETGETFRFALEDLASNLNIFGMLVGYDERRTYETEEDVNLAATDLLAALHDSLRASGYEGHQLRVLLVRIVFVLFADDTLVWERGAFHDYLTLRTRVDGSDLGPALIHLFQVLDTPSDRRSATLDDDLARFTYINGALFSEALRIPDCNRSMRERLLACSKFDWSAISPAIFGSMFQNVMTDIERRQIGAHYTTEANILRTINPLFMDGLWADLERARSLPDLRRFRDGLAELRFFDPACGCGNFLIIAYREIRRLELECLRRIRAEELRQAEGGRRYAGTGQLGIDVTVESKVHVGQFYGIEIEEFPARIAETAIYLIDHLENLVLSDEFGQYYARFPISDTAHITIGNALRMDWNDVVSAADCAYVFGNPPFVGMSWMTPEQDDDNTAVFRDSKVRVDRSGRLDYVACWYAKAWDYMRGHEIKAAFVSTNSLTQGEQARSMGPALKAAGYEIEFAHRTFAWTSEARGMAHVHVVIIGFAANPGRRRLFDYADWRDREPVESNPAHINWYLADGPDVFPSSRRAPLLPGLPTAIQGNKPWDGGGLIVTEDDAGQFEADPIASKYLRRFVQTTELLYDEQRYCLWLVDASPDDLRGSPLVRFRLQQVRAAREATRTEAVQRQAATPYLFSQIRQPTVPYLALPEVSSENRRYVPGAFLQPDVIAGNKLVVIPGASLWLFGVLQSSMWMAWVRTIAGRLESRISIAPNLCYHAFPFPDPEARRAEIESAAQEVLQTREGHGSSLATLYDAVSMPADLVAAHQRLDRAVDAAYGRGRYRGEADRLARLFARYEELTSADTLPGTAPARRRTSRSRRT